MGVTAKTVQGDAVINEFMPNLCPAVKRAKYSCYRFRSKNVNGAVGHLWPNCAFIGQSRIHSDIVGGTYSHYCLSLFSSFSSFLVSLNIHHAYVMGTIHNITAVITAHINEELLTAKTLKELTAPCVIIQGKRLFPL